jgi:chemotaxis protein MotB
MMNSEEDNSEEEIADLSIEEESEDEEAAAVPPPMAQPVPEPAPEEEVPFFNRRRRAPAGERREATSLWLISYSDFMTILFIFFLVMYGYAVLEREKIAPHGAAISTEALSKLMSRFQTTMDPSDVEIKEDLDKITVEMKDRVLFPSGSAEFTSRAKTALEELSRSVKLVQGDVIVQGHTDDVPIAGGRYRSNWELSVARAFSVVQEFTKNGVSPGRLAAWGFGENRPLGPNNKDEERQRNRRIEIIIFKKIGIG